MNLLNTKISNPLALPLRFQYNQNITKTIRSIHMGCNPKAVDATETLLLPTEINEILHGQWVEGLAEQRLRAGASSVFCFASDDDVLNTAVIAIAKDLKTGVVGFSEYKKNTTKNKQDDAAVGK
ncbi:uncharacterized protein ATC70_013283 [Mucor velutinosus]|uniref:Uncharacterized protein n=1 Tax=Mucor velutinosus TaxID=708070 RepID=A0AAN7DCN1_9FUNG|nr:hypothetical protein ATC70_013283 [Mucor velutinosus]